MVNITQARLIEYWVEDILDQYEQILNEDLKLPIPIIAIVTRLFGLRCDIEIFNGSLEMASGLIIPEKNWILVNKKDNIRRQRFTLAHELVHWLVDIHEGDIHEHGLEIPSGLRSSNKIVRESIANYFAAAILIPKKKLGMYLMNNSWLDAKYEAFLSKEFLVSQETMKKRLKELNYETKKKSTEDLSKSKDSKRFTQAGKKPKIKSDEIDLSVISLDFSCFDHNLIRALKSARNKREPLYILCNEDDADNVDILLSIKSVDGLILSRGKKTDRSGVICFRKSNLRYSFSNISQGPYYKRMVSGRHSRHKRSLPIFFRTSDKGLNSEQKQLIDIGWYIGSTSTLKYRSDAKIFISNAKKNGQKVVVATGCFDIVTVDHLRFLKRAKDAGDILVLGLEDDNRVKARKGPLRPVNTIAQRVELMEEFRFIDYVFVIAGSPKMEIKPFYTRLHKTLRADLLAVSDDDRDHEDKKEEIEAAGGRLLVVSPYGSVTTTSTIHKILTEAKRYNYLMIANKSLENREIINFNKSTQLQLPFELT